MRQRFPVLLAVLAVVAAALTAAPQPAHAEKAAAIEKSSRDALARLKQNSPAAAKLAPEAAAILVFPKIVKGGLRSEEHTSELQSLVRISYAVLCLKKKIQKI